MPKRTDLPAEQDEVDNNERLLPVKQDRCGEPRTKREQDLHNKYAFQVLNDSNSEASIVKEIILVLHLSSRLSSEEPDGSFKSVDCVVSREHFKSANVLKGVLRVVVCASAGLTLVLDRK